MKRLAIVCTHPIQYYAPLFALLAKGDIALKVFYTWGESSLKKHDPGFNKEIEWDIPLLEGYQYTFLKNTSKKQGSSHFGGIKNPEIIEEIQNFRPNAILLFGWAYHSHLKVLRHFKTRIPIWFRGDSTLLGDSSGVKKLIRNLFLSWVYSHVDIAFYVGEENRRYYKEFGLKDHQLLFAPHAIDNNRFDSIDSKSGSEIREHLNIPADHVVVLFVGKLEPVKNPELLLKAFINAGIQKSHLIFVGLGVLEDDLKKQATKHQNIHFVGFKNQLEIPSYYYSSNLFCLPSLSETWGLAVNEAMACGKAILISDRVGCGADLVKQGHNGYIFESDNLDSLQQKLSALLKNKNILEEYGTASKEIIKKWNFGHSAEVISGKLNRTENTKEPNG